MLSFEPELIAAREAGAISDATAARLIEGERRDVFSLYAEIRILAWLGATLIATGVGLLIKKHIEEIGPLTIVAILALAAAACYVWAWVRRGRESLIDDSVLLLGALLVSANAGYIESQWHLFGARALLFLAILHAIGAYTYKARGLLSLSISALAAWLGVAFNEDTIFSWDPGLAIRAFECVALLVMWRECDRRARGVTTFTPVFDHTAFTLAFWGGVILATSNEAHAIGLLITLVVGAASVVYGFRVRNEAFIVYAFLYGTFVMDWWLAVYRFFGTGAAPALLILGTTIAAMVGLYLLHQAFRSGRA
jgi:hypothetical protein